MKKGINRVILIVIIMIVLLIGLETKSKAALSVRTSKSTVNPGESFSVTVSVSSNEAGHINLSISNGSLSSTNIDLMSTSSVTVAGTARDAGTINISASGLVANYDTATEKEQKASTTITVQKPSTPSSGGTDVKDPVVGPKPASNPTNTTKPTPKPAAEQEKKSNDATLDSLLIEEGTFTPEFSKDVKEYSMEVENSVTELNVTANLSDFKAAVTIDGNKELKVGENIVTIKVVAEDGTVTEYIVKVNRKRENLALNSLKIYYLDENNETQEIYFTPEFSKEVLEYSVDNLSYLINSLKFDAVPNIEGAVVEITGNENLKEGENVITITITLPAQNEGEEDEVIVYTVKVNKEPKPVLTLMGRIKNWFGGIGSAISTWYKNNQYMIIISSLSLCSACMAGLAVYLIIDYKKYKVLLAKVAEITKSNNTNDILVQETNLTETNNELEVNVEEPEKEVKTKGRHF